MKKLSLVLSLVLLSACGADVVEDGTEPVVEDEYVGPDLPVGDVTNPKADGVWGFATECKPVPDLEPLKDPAVVISLDGLTLHLFDRQGDYDKVFPIGPGAPGNNGLSLTPTGEFTTRSDEPAIDDTAEIGRWGWNHRCRMWWTDSSTGRRSPVFGGLPFIRLDGPGPAVYGMHGPVDNFTNANGGTLRRGFVSHGCVRMEAADVVELWALIQGHRAPVRIQKAIERDLEGSAQDTKDKWLLSECDADSDCGFDGGVCRKSDYSQRGFCTMACTSTCPDKKGQPTSFCIADGDGDTGYCTLKSERLNNSCDRYDSFVVSNEHRPSNTARSADVCIPGSEGWIGDKCLSSDECTSGHCTPVAGGPAGICSEPCERFCADGDVTQASTFCVKAPESVVDEGGICVAQCDRDEECPIGTACTEQGRFGQDDRISTVCLPD
jgi:hypothetical protein